jgi:hypothetical protein
LKSKWLCRIIVFAAVKITNVIFQFCSHSYSRWRTGHFTIEGDLWSRRLSSLILTSLLFDLLIRPWECQFFFCRTPADAHSFWIGFCFVHSFSICLCVCVSGFPISSLFQWLFSFGVLFPPFQTYLHVTLKPEEPVVFPIVCSGIISTLLFFRNVCNPGGSNATHFIVLWRMSNPPWSDYNFQLELSSNHSSCLISGMIPHPTPSLY